MMIDYGKELQKAYDDGYKDRDAEIVRCKDCKHSQEQGHWRYCKFDRHDGVELDSDWFCADGVRKEKEDG